MKFKKLVSVVLSTAMAALAMAGCGETGDGSAVSSGTETVGNVSKEQNADQGTPAADVDTYGFDKTAKIGVLVSDASTAEALSFRAYYEEYLESQYDVDFIYSEELTDAAGEIDAIDQFTMQGCQGIISLSSFDRPGQIEMCEDAGIYYGVAAGTLTDEQYETYREYTYFVGSVGPSLETEYQTGYDMAQFFIDEGKTNFLIFTGAAAYGTEMHIYRVAGMIAAMNEADPSSTYGGASTKDDIIAAIYGTLGIDEDSFESDTFTISAVNGYNMDDAWWGEISEKLFATGLEAVLAVGNGSDFFGSMAQGAVEVGSVDTYAQDYADAMANNQLTWMAGKFAPGIAPIFVAVLDAINGAPLRTADGNAFQIDQGYWYATSAEEFDKYLASSSVESPVYDKSILDNYFSTPENVVSYDDFEAFVGAYTFDEIQALNQ